MRLKDSPVIVSGGAGVGSEEDFQLIRELANALGGEVGASRAAVDSGLIGKEHQVGQTGTTVRPRLYIAAGISGAIQHRAGMSESNKIIAINTDPEAPIFQIAQYKIVGDLNEVIPLMISALREKAKVGDQAMADNFYLDNPDLRFRVESADLGEVVDLKERGYAYASDRAQRAPRDLRTPRTTGASCSRFSATSAPT